MDQSTFLCACGCGLPVQRTGYRYRRNHLNPAPTVAERFWAKVKKTDGCWLWTASSHGSMRYGVFGPTPHHTVSAHRFAWELSHGPIPGDLCVLHRCDVPRCVRPDHLFLGTRADNMADAKAKGRTVSGDLYWARAHPEKVHRGERHWNVKLTDEQCGHIRARLAAGETAIALSREFGVSDSTISLIRTGKRRKI